MNPYESPQAPPPLFRKEAIQHRARRLEGEVLLGTPLSWTALGYLAATVLAIALTFASLSTYARKETVAGWVIPHAGIIRISARGSGVIEDLRVREGDDVRKGVPLALVRLAVDTANGDSGHIQIGALREQIEASRQSASSQIDKVEMAHADLVKRQHILRAQRAEAMRHVGILESQASLADAGVARARKLVGEGYLSQHGLDQAMAALLAAREEVSTARSGLLSIDQALAQLDHQIAARPLLIAQARSEASGRQASLRQRLEQATAGNAYTLTSPVNGTVVAVPVDLGQAVRPGTTMLMLTPADSPLEAELFVPSRAAGFLRAGQSVALRYQAFPFQKFGSANGHVISVSRTALDPTDIAPSSLHVEEPVFRVRVALEKDYVAAYGDRIPLLAGMLLEADVVLEHRSLLEWLLDPLYAAGQR